MKKIVFLFTVFSILLSPMTAQAIIVPENATQGAKNPFTQVLEFEPFTNQDQVITDLFFHKNTVYVTSIIETADFYNPEIYVDKYLLSDSLNKVSSHESVKIERNKDGDFPLHSKKISNDDGFYALDGNLWGKKFTTSDIFYYSSETNVFKKLEVSQIDKYESEYAFILDGQLKRYSPETRAENYGAPRREGLDTFVDGVGWVNHFVDTGIAKAPQQVYFQRGDYPQLYLFGGGRSATFKYDIYRDSLTRLDTYHPTKYSFPFEYTVPSENELHLIRTAFDSLAIVTVFDFANDQFVGEIVVPSSFKTLSPSQFSNYFLEEDDGKVYLYSYDGKAIDRSSVELFEQNDWTKHEKDISILYEEVLHRSADPEGLNYWTNLYYTGELTLNQIKEHFLTSDEYDRLRVEEIFVELYRNVLLREPTYGALYNLGMEISHNNLHPDGVYDYFYQHMDEI